jgi:uncharacterized protein
MTDWYSIRGADLLLRLRIQPRSSRAGLAEVRDGRLRVRVSAPPVDGAANESLIRLIAHALDVPRASVRLTRGEKSRDKEILVLAGAARSAELIARLDAFTPGHITK